MEQQTFTKRLRGAVEDGVMITVRYGVALLLTLGLLAVVVQDYLATRTNAQKGSAAFTFIQQQLAAQKK